MSLTIKQLHELGFRPTKKSSPFAKKYDTLIFPLNDSDYLYLGYDNFKRSVNNKIIWKSFIEPDTKKRIAYQVIQIGDTGYTEMKAFLERSKINANYKYTVEEQEYLDGRIN